MNPLHVIFVVPFFLPATLRFVQGAASLPGLRLSIISQDPREKLPAELSERLLGHWRVEDCFDPQQLLRAAQALGQRFGAADRLIGSLEQLQVPLAEARQQLQLPGLDVAAAQNFRDKNRMKDVFAAARLPCARHSLVTSQEVAREFAARVGFPLVVKPLAGAGAKNTFRLNDARQLEEYLQTSPPVFSEAVLFEEFLRGDEYSFDSIMRDGRVIWHSISCYRPSPLTVIENPWIQWCVLLPRELDAPPYQEIRRVGERALLALGLRDGMTHMEWFRRPNGAIAISEVAARPPGAQFTSLISWVSNLDFYRAWPKLQVFNAFEAPQRQFSAGAAYLRGMGQGRVRFVHGLDTIRHELGDIMVESHWPQPGSLQPAGYEGAGYVIFRHPQTQVVENALRRTVEVVRVELG